MRTERSADCSSTPLCGPAISTEAREGGHAPLKRGRCLEATCFEVAPRGLPSLAQKNGPSAGARAEALGGYCAGR
jgi:hypothetical protein